MESLKPEFISNDGRRILTQLVTAPIAQVNSYHAKKGAVLGNHFHKETTEYFYITKGTILYNSERIFNKGDLFVVNPHTYHTLEIMSPEATFLSFLTKAYTKENPDLWTKES